MLTTELLRTRCRRVVAGAVGCAVLATAAVLLPLAAPAGSASGVAQADAASGSSANLLANGSFESAGNRPTAFSSATTLTVARTTSAEAGSYYARVSSHSSTITPVGLVNRPAVTGLAAGTKLSATCYVRTNNTRFSAILRITEVRSNGTHVVKERGSAPYTTTGAWTAVTATDTVAASGSQVFVGVYSSGPTSANQGALGVDNCSLQRVSTLPAAPVAPAIPTTVPSGYTRAFTEDFTQNAARGKFDSVYGKQFGQYSGCCNTNGTTYYSSAKVLSASNGSMYYYLHSEGGQSYTAAPVPGNFLNFTYGQVGLSLRLDSSVGDGYKVAFLLWPKTQQWTNEVDFPEVYPDFAHNVYAASLNTTTQDGTHTFVGGPLHASSTTLADGKYHTFLLTWQPGKLTFTIDGAVYATYTGSAVPSQAMHVVLQAEGWKDSGAVPSGSSATIEVPYVFINTRN